MATTQQQRDAFGPLLRTLRRARGYKQWQVAEVVDLTAQAVSGWERGTHAPETREVALKLDDFLAAGGQILDVLGYARSTADETADQAIARLSAEVAALKRSLATQPPKRKPRQGGR